MIKLFRADFELNTIYEIDINNLVSRGIKYALCDLDNTLADYDTPLPTEQVRTWLDSMKDAGIQVAIVSNNGRARVEKFCETLNIPFFWKSGKPKKRAVRNALNKLGGKLEETVLIGDKRTTDVICAKNAGILSIKVKSIKPRTILWKKK